MYVCMYVCICHYQLKIPHIFNNSTEKYTNNFFKCKNNNEQALSVQNTLVYFGHSRTMTLSGLFETLRMVNGNTKTYSTKNYFSLLKDKPNTCVKYMTRDNGNLTSPAGSRISSFKTLFNPLQIDLRMCS